MNTYDYKTFSSNFQVNNQIKVGVIVLTYFKKKFQIVIIYSSTTHHN